MPSTAPTSRQLDAALNAWRELLGGQAVSCEEPSLSRYMHDTSDFSTRPAAVLRPGTQAEVAGLVQIAAQHGVPLHPLSSGRNWGYGTANAPGDGCVLVDLSRMNAIRSFDPELGLVVVEPGVTQGRLRSWLDQRGLDFMVPTTGAGPECSLVGNALERGYGLTPVGDHFASVAGIEAVLADGSRYRSPMWEAGNGFKWGLGPYLDGLFSQGNAGIVTAMSIMLARRPERVEAFYFWIDSDRQLEAAVEAVRGLLQVAGSSIGGINLMNATRVLAMSSPYPRGHARDGEPVAEAAMEALARKSGMSPWMGMGALYGSRRHAAATRWLVRRSLSGIARRVVFMTPGKAGWAASVLGRLPGQRMRRLAGTMELMREALALLEGRPSQVALPLAYWKSAAQPGDEANPALDGCGLLWYAPIVPIRASDARRFVDMARTICRTHGFEAPITLTSISERSFDCTLPLLFARDDAQACRRADQCWRALFAAGRDAGFMPYRLHTRYAGLAVDRDEGYWRMAAQVKRAIDPQGLFSPGRWQPRPRDGDRPR